MSRSQPFRQDQITHSHAALRHFSSQSSSQAGSGNDDDGEEYDENFYQNNDASSAYNKMPITMQREVVKCLKTLQISSNETQEAIDIKRIKEQYLRMAQQYHPDAVAQ